VAIGGSGPLSHAAQVRLAETRVLLAAATWAALKSETCRQCGGEGSTDACGESFACRACHGTGRAPGTGRKESGK